ncbi:MAG: hypothetical protein ACWGMT_07210 [Burkholderiales bacterium]
MLTLEPRSGTGQLARAFAEADTRLTALEESIGRGEPAPLSLTVDEAIRLTTALIAAYLVEEGKKEVLPASDLLEMLKVLVKGEPSWHAIRDNCRELVYYRNCINMERQDALPPVPEKMAVRTARHVYLYMRTRCLREGMLQA